MRKPEEKVVGDRIKKLGWGGGGTPQRILSIFVTYYSKQNTHWSVFYRGEKKKIFVLKKHSGCNVENATKQTGTKAGRGIRGYKRPGLR